MRRSDLKRRRGVTLIMVAGVLAVLAALGAGFYTLTVSQSRSTMRYADTVSADLMARAGLVDAIGRLRELSMMKTEDPTDPWFTVDYQHGAQKRVSFAAKNPKPQSATDKYYSFSRSLSNRAGANSDRYVLSVTDAASKININACDNLGVVLDNLCRAIGAPLIAADLDWLQPARWAKEGASGYSGNKDDSADQGSCYYMPTQSDKRTIDPSKPPVVRADGSARYGDGYAIARYRASHGPFKDINDVRLALTAHAAPNHPELEELERNVKFDALRDYITINSWIDTNTVCTGKFEWIKTDSTDAIAIDRDKSWVEDDPVNDPLNKRGSLRGCYLSIVNGHGAGQLRRIKTNGVDWVKVDKGFTVDPGPISSYMIVAKEDALTDSAQIPNGLGPIEFPRENADGSLVDDPNIDYATHPLCIHRAPVNINTASEKVLVALFMGINIQHGHPMAVGTDADLTLATTAWRKTDPHQQEPYLLTYEGIKRVPASSGKLVLNCPKPWKDDTKYGYINNFSSGGKDNYFTVSDVCNEAHELAYRVIRLREKSVDAAGRPVKGPDPDPELDKEQPQPRGPFTSWDDFYFRVVRPWDAHRVDPNYNPAGYLKKIALSPMLMANFNPNTDILKFNPNIEWIDRWGRNFTEMEPVMQFTDSPEPHTNNPSIADPISKNSIPIYPTGELRGFHGLQYRIKDHNTGIEGTYVIRSFRYRSTDLIDKTDLNRSTTEFSFDSGGLFEITSVGQVVTADQSQSERRIDALVKLYDVWRETTQAQFVKGVISRAVGKPGSNQSGTIVRALVARKVPNVSDRLALITQPEPLVPVNYRIKNGGLPSIEVVDPHSKIYDAWGREKTKGVPDIVANHVQPASFDGQLTLSTNMEGFSPDIKLPDGEEPPNPGDNDTFLASFNGDLDTDTCVGNGHEQAKMPHIETGRNSNQGFKYRVVDTCGLLGILNDDLIDMEPDYKLRRKMYMFRKIDDALSGLKKENYWNNVTLRMGDLRTEGVYLSSPGVSGNDATLKYLVGEKFENFNPGSPDGFLLTMWFKSTWKHNDGRNHEFFNSSNPGKFYNARACYLQKEGRWAFAGSGETGGISGAGKRGNDLMWAFEGVSNFHNDRDLVAWMHGGRNRVAQLGYNLSWENGNTSGAGATANTGESSMYRVQPFRWNYVGVRLQYEKGTTAPASPQDVIRGRFTVSGDGSRTHLVSNFSRCFMATQMYPEGRTYWKPEMYWATVLTNNLGHFDKSSNQIGRSYQSTQDKGSPSLDTTKHAIDFRYPSDQGGTSGQDVKWNWADPKSDIEDPRFTQKVFSINNLNYGNSDKDMDANDASDSSTDQSNMWIYRHLPDGGTYAVIDELKISKRETVLGGGNYDKDRAVREMSTSRYYLPVDPGNTGQCPTFESQTMLESVKGAQKLAVANETLTLARVTWTAFTPRFMHEYQQPTGKFGQTEILLRKQTRVPFKGPFWYETYNNLQNGASVRFDRSEFDASAVKGSVTYGKADATGQIFPYRVNRIAPALYPANVQPHSTRGVEIELLNDSNIIGGYVNKDGVYTAVNTFVDPDADNTFFNPAKATKTAQVAPDKLRYRVRFRYYIDSTFVDKGEERVDPSRMLLLDTPVFDDISITYFGKPRYLAYKEATE